MRTIDASQQAALDRRDTKPVYIIEINVDGQEYLSSNGDRVVSGTTYVGADVGITSIENWSSARLKLLPNPARVNQFISQSWRYGTCRISLLPTTYDPEIIEDDYVVDDYASQGEQQFTPILLIDGELTSASLSANSLEFTIANRVSVGRWLPALRIAPPICNHLPKVGTVIVWQGDNYTLEAR